MIKITTIAEITGTLLREDLKPEFQKMSLKELRKLVLNHIPEKENKIKNAFCDLYNVHIKNVIVTEDEQ